MWSSPAPSVLALTPGICSGFTRKATRWAGSKSKAKACSIYSASAEGEQQRCFAAVDSTGRPAGLSIVLAPLAFLLYNRRVGDVTRILDQMQQGDPMAGEELLPLVYEELRRLAAAKMAQERPGQTLQATALVHEAWLRLAGSCNQTWDNKAHFFGAAAEAMRRILVDNARRKRAQKHGANAERVEIGGIEFPAPLSDERLLALDEGLAELSREDPEAAELVKLRWFVGLPHREAAAVMGLGHTKADQVWLFAKAWLARFLEET